MSAAFPRGWGKRKGLLEFFYLEAVDSIEVLVEGAWTRGKVDGARLSFQFSDAWGKKASRQVVTAGGRARAFRFGRAKSAGDCLPRGMFGLFDCGNQVERRPIRACAPKEHVFAKFTEQTDPNSGNGGQWINGQASRCI